MEQQKLSFFAVEEAEGYSPVWKIIWQLLTLLSYDPVITFLGIYIKNLYPHKNPHTDVYSSFIEIAKIWKQPSCPSVGKWINKLWSIQTAEHYPVRKRNELSNCEDIEKT